MTAAGDVDLKGIASPSNTVLAVMSGINALEMIQNLELPGSALALLVCAYFESLVRVIPISR